MKEKASGGSDISWGFCLRFGMTKRVEYTEFLPSKVCRKAHFSAAVIFATSLVGALHT
jgi:hypothetical protein